MSQKVSYSDLFDFTNDKEVQLAIKLISSLEKTYNKLVASLGKEISGNQAGLASLVNQVSALNTQLQKANPSTKQGQEAILKISKAAENASIGYKSMTDRINELIKTQVKYKNEQEKVLSKVKESIRLQNEEATLQAKLFAAESNRAKSVALLKEQIAQKNAEVKRAAKESLGLVTIYDKEVARLDSMIKKYRDLAITNQGNTKEARALKSEINQLDRQIKTIDASVGRHQKNVGNYSSALKGAGNAARQFVGAFGVVGGVTMLAYLIKDTFDLVKQTQTLDKALKQVTETEAEHAKQQQFLREISDAYGLNINRLTESYTKFYVATKGTNLEGEQTQKIFTSVVKSLAAMGASTEDSDRALRALYQMISKGKIQAEELRGQLGDVLPGAFQIMAKALNVTTSELDKMLKDGKLMADEVLPKFAVELERSFGVEQLERVDTLTAAQTRLTNAWVTFVQRVENGEGLIAKAFIAITDAIASGLNSINQSAIDSVSEFLDTYKNDAGKTAGDVVRAYAKMSPDVFFSDVVDTQKMFSASLLAFGLDVESSKDVFLELYKLQKQAASGNLSGILAKQTKELKEETVLTEDEFNKLHKEMKEGLYIYPKLRKEMMLLATSNDEAAKKTKELSGQYSPNGTLQKGVDKFLESFETKAPEAVKKTQTSFDKFTNKLKTTYSAFGEYINAGFQIAQIAVNQFFTNSQINAQNDLKAFEDAQNAKIDILEEKRDKELANEQLTAEQKAAINQRYALQISKIETEIERKRKESQRKQAVNAKAQAALNVALNTAQGVTAALADLNVPLSIAIAAIGAAELAAVLSQPIPAFEKGTDNAPGGIALVGEKGREIVVEPSGRVYMTGNKAELRDIPKGSEILTNSITERILKQKPIEEMPNIYDKVSINLQKVARQEKLQLEDFRNTLAITMRKENDELISGILRGMRSIPMNNWSFNDKGQPERSIRKGSTIIRNAKLDAKY